MTLKNKSLNESRTKLLKEILDKKGFVRVIEAHNGLSAIIGNDVYINLDNGEKLEFDALWISSLTDSAAKGHPDAEILGFDSRLDTINEIAEVTNKPMILDGDTGRDFTYFEYMVKKLERAGVSAVIIEDKIFPKRNSLEANAKQDLEDPEIFATKIKRGKEVSISKEFMIIARLESLIAGKGQEDALMRAKTYLLAGVDGIMIHSKSKSGDDIITFAEKYEELCRELGFRKPLICVPTTYNIVSEEELKDNGVNIIIHANHMLRASHKAMENAARSILLNRRSFETDPICSSVNEIFKIVGFEDVIKKDKDEFSKSKINVVIPAAGRHSQLELNKPCCMLDINGKTILERQIEVLNKLNLNDIIVIRGYERDKINVPNLKYYDNEDYKDTGVLHSLMKAEKDIKNGFIIVFSDLIFDKEVIKKLLETEGDIIVAGDDSYQYHKHEVDKNLDLIITKNKYDSLRKIKTDIENPVLMIGENIKKDAAQYEFVGIAKFSKEGANNLINVYRDCENRHKGRFHEADTFKNASMTDILQEMIDRGFKVVVGEVHKGWIEVHNTKDYEKIKEILK